MAAKNTNPVLVTHASRVQTRLVPGIAKTFLGAWLTHGWGNFVFCQATRRLVDVAKIPPSLRLLCLFVAISSLGCDSAVLRLSASIRG